MADHDLQRRLILAKIRPCVVRRSLATRIANRDLQRQPILAKIHRVLCNILWSSQFTDLVCDDILSEFGLQQRPGS
ncbi:hypothetical protein L484_007034 [Morus notabilis]|uniref:Uncharacterized protein n=1 Tax=Morus notabilis TaxID=981085 RepID=W9SCG5_9ROSA|nr:hypothetical protein L484_007034 [Morus notabilis]